MQPVSQGKRDLSGRVRAELRSVNGLDPSAIVVTEHHGHITLHGRVASRADREDAMRAVRRVQGVRSTVDRIRVREAP